MHFIFCRSKLIYARSIWIEDWYVNAFFFKTYFERDTTNLKNSVIYRKLRELYTLHYVN